MVGDASSFGVFEDFTLKALFMVVIIWYLQIGKVSYLSEEETWLLLVQLLSRV